MKNGRIPITNTSNPLSRNKLLSLLDDSTPTDDRVSTDIDAVGNNVSATDITDNETAQESVSATDNRTSESVSATDKSR